MIPIYYKNNQLDKWRTARSLVKYYVKCYIAKEPVSKIVVDTSITE
jgi:hypothetical protein